MPCSTAALPCSLRVAEGEDVQAGLVLCTVSGCSILIHTPKQTQLFLKQFLSQSVTGH